MCSKYIHSFKRNLWQASVSDRTGASVRQDSCSTQHLPIKWMEGLAFRKDNQETCAHSADKIRAELSTPSKLGFWCKVTAIHIATQPTKGSIFNISKKKSTFFISCTELWYTTLLSLQRDYKSKSFQQFTISVCNQGWNCVNLQSLWEETPKSW